MPYWETLLEVGGWVMQLARELAKKEGVDPVDFDRRVADMEARRAATINSTLERLRALLQ